MEAIVREARYSDWEGIAASMCRNGMPVDGVPQDVWTSLWQDNPVVRELPSLPIGWVLEAGGAIVGYLGSVPLRYHFLGKSLIAVAARGFVVDAAYRRQTLRLMAAFLSQKSVELFLNTTANVAAAAVFQLCKAQRIPQPDCDKALFWITDASGFAAAAARKAGHGRAVTALAPALIGGALRIEGWLRRRAPARSAAAREIRVLEACDVGKPFDMFWEKMLAVRSRCLLADRSAPMLRWHYGNRAASVRQARFVCAFEGGRILGYAVVTREDAQDIGLKRSRIVDLVADGDNPRVVDALLRAAFDHARSEGSHVLELLGFPARIRARCAAARAHVRQLPTSPYWYKAAKALEPALRDEEVWYGCSYDGDASL